MYEDALQKLDDFDKEIKSQELKLQSLVVTGQRMANVLKVMIDDCSDESLLEEAKELIQRWEKEFK